MMKKIAYFVCCGVIVGYSVGIYGMFIYVAGQPYIGLISDFTPDSEIHDAAAHGDIKKIDKEIVGNKVNVDLPLHRGQLHFDSSETPLSWALMNQQWQAARHLLVRHKSTIFPSFVNEILCFTARHEKTVNLDFLDELLTRADNKKSLLEYSDLNSTTYELRKYTPVWQVAILKVLFLHGLTHSEIKKAVAEEKSLGQESRLRWIDTLLDRCNWQHKINQGAARVIARDFQKQKQSGHIPHTPSHATEWPRGKDIQELCLAYEKSNSKVRTIFSQKYSPYPRSFTDIAVMCLGLSKEGGNA